MRGCGQRVRLLGPHDLDEVSRVLAQDPLTHVLVDHRVRRTGLDPRLFGAELWGWPTHGSLRSLCHAGANLIPVEASDEAVAEFSDEAHRQGRRCAAILGPDPQVRGLWDHLGSSWGPARDVRLGQPFMVLDRTPAVTPDPRVRRARPRELDLLYPACVAMFTEEVGVSPEAGQGKQMYRARVAQLIAQGLSFVWFEGDEVVFKAEIGAMNPACVQIQGVWVNPLFRGQGLAAAALAEACRIAIDELAPVVTLYVNRHNVPARRLYERVGFREHAKFATVLF